MDIVYSKPAMINILIMETILKLVSRIVDLINLIYIELPLLAAFRTSKCSLVIVAHHQQLTTHCGYSLILITTDYTYLVLFI